jgi:hypothetical protein
VSRFELEPVAEIRQARAEHRCYCGECLALDLRFPGRGYQLGFWRWSPGGPMRLTNPELVRR